MVEQGTITWHPPTTNPMHVAIYEVLRREAWQRPQVPEEVTRTTTGRDGLTVTDSLRLSDHHYTYSVQAVDFHHVHADSTGETTSPKYPYPVCTTVEGDEGPVAFVGVMSPWRFPKTSNHRLDVMFSIERSIDSHPRCNEADPPIGSFRELCTISTSWTILARWPLMGSQSKAAT